MLNIDLSSLTICMDEYDPNALTVDQARQQIYRKCSAITTAEKLAIRETLHRTLSHDVISPINVPSHTNSAMDGYALLGSDIPTARDGLTKLKIVGTVMAGTPINTSIQTGQCVRIMTGGKLPDGIDTVVMQERVKVEGDYIQIDSTIKSGQHVRRAGEDITRRDVVLTKGHCIRPADLGLLASLGIGEISVYRRVRVAFFSTGNELRSIGETLEEGQIYDSNRYTIYGMLKQFGADILDLGTLPDDRSALREAFLAAADLSDVLITSRGVSVGAADYVKEILQEVGAVNFWKIAIKPGRPLAFGSINHCLFFGLPGNPVSAMVTFYQFVLPALYMLNGRLAPVPRSLRVRCESELRKSPGRIDFQRGILQIDATGNAVVRSTGEQGSGILSSMSKANCFIVLPLECGDLSSGSIVEVQPFEWFDATVNPAGQ